MGSLFLFTLKLFLNINQLPTKTVLPKFRSTLFPILVLFCSRKILKAKNLQINCIHIWPYAEMHSSLVDIWLYHCRFSLMHLQCLIFSNSTPRQLNLLLNPILIDFYLQTKLHLLKITRSPPVVFLQYFTPLHSF